MRISRELHQLLPVDAVEVLTDVHLHYPADLAPLHRVRQRIQRVVRRTPRPEPVVESVELRLVDRIEDLLHHRPLDDLVLQRGNTQLSHAPVRLRYLYPPDRSRPVRSTVYAVLQVKQPLGQFVPVLAPRHPVHARGRIPLQREIRCLQRLRRDVVQQRGQLLPRILLRKLPYPLRPGCHRSPTLCPDRARALRIPNGIRPAAGGSLADWSWTLLAGELS